MLPLVSLTSFEPALVAADGIRPAKGLTLLEASAESSGLVAGEGMLEVKPPKGLLEAADSPAKGFESPAAGFELSSKSTGSAAFTGSEGAAEASLAEAEDRFARTMRRLAKTSGASFPFGFVGSASSPPSAASLTSPLRGSGSGELARRFPLGSSDAAAARRCSVDLLGSEFEGGAGELPN